MSESTEQKQSRSGLIVRVLLILLGLTLLGCMLFFGGGFLYSLGERTAENIAGVDETLTNMPTPTSITLTATTTLTPEPSLTPTITPTATITPLPWTTCPGIMVTRNDTAQGDILHVVRCEDGFEYDLGPLSKGAYAVSPDNKYLVYAGVNGILYGAKIGDTALYTIKNLKRDGAFTVFPKKIVPRFQLEFVGDQAPYVLNVFEEKYQQNYPVPMPSWLSE